jgi:monoterpene epsilon-lactone hydrolase
MFEHTVGPRLPELRALALDLALRTQMKRKYASITDEGLRRGAKRLSRTMAGAKVPRFVQVEATCVGGRPAEWVRAAVGATQKVVLYLHGGGFYMSSPIEHRELTWRLSRACSRAVLAIDYRKAPDHQFPAWVDDAVAAYHHLLQRGHAPQDIVVSGDSAGGNIALALVHRIRREGLAMPEALVLFSPWADLLCEAASFRTNRLRDSMFDADAVRALGRYLTRGCDARDPEVSPAYADFRGFPRMLVLAGSTEVFLDDARNVVRRARQAGVAAELYVFRHMPHVFPMFAAYVPRAKAAFDLVREFVADEQVHTDKDVDVAMERR